MLYQPHRCKRIQIDDPSAVVLVCAFTAKQLLQWPAPCSTRLRSHCYLDLAAKAAIASRR